MRPWIMFTKHLEGYDLGQIIDGLKSAGVEGADLCVRPGYPVNPENAPTELPAAAKRFADEGFHPLSKNLALAVDRDGRVYAADPAHRRVRIFVSEAP